jgi:hypothetical protein
MDKPARLENNGLAGNTEVQITGSKRLRPSFLSLVGYICCWPVCVTYCCIPGGDTSNCLPYSTLALVTLCLFLISAFQRAVRYLAKGIFYPLWESLDEFRREKIGHQLCDIVIRSTTLGVFLWIVLSQEQDLVRATVSLDMEKCPRQTVALLLGVQYFYAMMIHELLTMTNMNKGLVGHHVVVIFSLLTLTEPSVKAWVDSAYYFSTFGWIIVGGQCMAVVSPAFVYYHLYPDHAFGQFACYAWVSASKTVIITICFLLMPYYVIWSNHDKMNLRAFWVIFLITTINVTAEFFVLRINIKISLRKYVEWKYKKADRKKET